jgi:hypothetical protein
MSNLSNVSGLGERTVLVACVTLVMSSFVACGGSSESDGDTEEADDRQVSSEERRPTIEPSEAIWLRQGDRERISISAEQYLCTLSGIGGNFSGPDEGVSLELEDGQWVATLRSGHSDPDGELSAYVHCTPRQNFYSRSKGELAWSEEGVQTLDSDGGLAGAEPEWSSTDHLTAISGISGEMEGGRARYADPPGHELEIDSQEGALEATFLGFGFDDGDDSPPQLAFYDNRHEYQIYSSGSTERKLPNSSEAHCFLTEIWGDFDGLGESVELSIHHIDRHWRLEVNAGCRETDSGLFSTSRCVDGKKPVGATAKCVLYEQP